MVILHPLYAYRFIDSAANCCQHEWDEILGFFEQCQKIIVQIIILHVYNNASRHLESEDGYCTRIVSTQVQQMSKRAIPQIEHICYVT